MNITEPGGFLIQSLPSPSPSSVSNSSTASSLPHPRSHPLRAGSAKEDVARRYVEGRLLHISRRYTKKFQPEQEGDDVHGYDSVVDVAKDLSEVVNVLWLSGTPSLQVPYLLNVALAVTSYLPAFQPAPISTFALLKKLDHAFSSLLVGQDSVTGEGLPGFQASRRAGMSKTDMVRCKSLVEATRVLIVDIMSKEPVDERVSENPPTDTETDTEVEAEAMSIDVDGAFSLDDEYEMDVARVYAATIVQLNELLGDNLAVDNSL